MNRNEAIQAMREGKKVRHHYFLPDEYMSMTPDGNYLLEEGVVCTPYEFWKYRSEKQWDANWEIFNE